MMKNRGNDSSFHSPSSSISSLCEEPGNKPDIQIYVLAEEKRTANSYVIAIGSDNRVGKNKAVALDEVIAWQKKYSWGKMMAINLLKSKDGPVHVKFVVNN
ncbi:hypothetical protein SDJN02_22880, partial [Cucurbita argyrosperma subsp. argyrosperma]